MIAILTLAKSNNFRTNRPTKVKNAKIDHSEHHSRALARFAKAMADRRYTRSTVKLYSNVVQRFLLHHREHHPFELSRQQADDFLQHHSVASLQASTLKVMQVAVLLYLETCIPT